MAKLIPRYQGGLKVTYGNNNIINNAISNVVSHYRQVHPKKLQKLDDDTYYGGKLGEIILTKTIPNKKKPYFVSSRTGQTTLGNLLTGIDVTTGPLLHWMQPSQYAGAISDAIEGKNPLTSMLRGNTGFFSEEYAKKHPVVSTLGNMIADVGILATPKALNTVKAINNTNLAKEATINTQALQTMSPKPNVWHYNIENSGKLPIEGFGIIPKIRTKVGDVEIDNPQLAYRQGTTEMGDDFIKTGVVNAEGEFDNPMFARGRLWYGLREASKKETQTKKPTGRFLLSKGKRDEAKPDLIVSNADMSPSDQRAHPMSDITTKEMSHPFMIKDYEDLPEFNWFMKEWDNAYYNGEIPNTLPVTRVSREQVRLIPRTEGGANKSNSELFRFEPDYGYRKVETQEPRTSLKFFERRPSRITESERLGLSKGDRGNLSLNQKQAIEDLVQYRNSGQYRQVFRVTPDWENFGWNLSRDNPTFMQQFVADGESMRGPWASVVLQTPTGKGVVSWNPEKNMGVYNSRMFKQPQELKYSPGEANMMLDGPNHKVILTSPRVDIQDFMDELVNGTIEDQNLFKSLDSQLKRTIDKDVIKDFWINSRKAQRPGSYMSGDNGRAPLGSTLIEAFKKKQLHKTPILERPIDQQITRRTGLSPDSYSSIIRQGNRDGSLRWGEGFTNWNNSAVENKFVSDAFRQLKNKEITPEQYEKIFNEWSLSIGGRPLQWVTIRGQKIPVHPHPYIYAKKQGGKMKGAFKVGHDIADSNPKAYKYVKKKYKMHQQGGYLSQIIPPIINTSNITGNSQQLNNNLQYVNQLQKQKKDEELRKMQLEQQKLGQISNFIGNLAVNSLNKNGVPNSLATPNYI